MKRLRIGSIALFLAAGPALVPMVYAGSGTKATVEGGEAVYEGILIDTKCYAQDPANLVNDHDSPAGTMMQCGTACAASGVPVGLLQGGKAGGAVHVLLVPSRGLASYVGKWARVTGRIALPSTLLVERLEVRQKDGTFKKVAIVSMM